MALALGLLKRRNASNAARLVASVAMEDWGVAEVTDPFARAVAAGTPPVAYAALMEAFTALKAMCADARVPWESEDVSAVVPKVGVGAARLAGRSGRTLNSAPRTR
jgi:hypothetical protein